jgi:hypothetical protein
MVAKVINELVVLGHHVAAEQYANSVGKTELAKKIRFGQFRPERKGFGPERAKARVEAVTWLAQQRKAA